MPVLHHSNTDAENVLSILEQKRPSSGTRWNPDNNSDGRPARFTQQLFCQFSAHPWSPEQLGFSYTGQERHRLKWTIMTGERVVGAKLPWLVLLQSQEMGSKHHCWPITQQAQPFFFFQLFSLVGARDLCRLSQLNTKAAPFLRPSLWWATGSVIYCFTFHTVKKGIFIQYFMPFGLLQ